MIDFVFMGEAGLRQWVINNPTRINDTDEATCTPLFTAVTHRLSLAFIVWLVDEKGADTNVPSQCSRTPLYMARGVEILKALLARGADPRVRDKFGATPHVLGRSETRRRRGMSASRRSGDLHHQHAISKRRTSSRRLYRPSPCQQWFSD